jgi:hypothetical protein
MLPGVVAIDFPERTPHSWVDAATSACEAALGDRRCVDAPESARQLRFQDIDPDRQRWASAGVVIAAMVSASEAGRAPSEEPLQPHALHSRRPSRSPEGRTDQHGLAPRAGVDRRGRGDRAGLCVRVVAGVITWDALAQLRLQHYSVVTARTLNGIEQTDSGDHCALPLRS